jgi:hypothetical protein
MPVLIFTEREDGVLIISNVSKGPAMNIVYVQSGVHKQRVMLKNGVHEVWFNPIHLRPIPPGGKTEVRWDWWREFDGLGLRYTDLFGAACVVKASSDGMVLFEEKRRLFVFHRRRHLPEWDLKKLPYPWHLDRRGLKPDGRLWCARPERLDPNLARSVPIAAGAHLPRNPPRTPRSLVVSIAQGVTFGTTRPRWMPPHAATGNRLVERGLAGPTELGRVTWTDCQT